MAIRGLDSSCSHLVAVSRQQPLHAAHIHLPGSATLASSGPTAHWPGFGGQALPKVQGWPGPQRSTMKSPGRAKGAHVAVGECVSLMHTP